MNIHYGFESWTASQHAPGSVITVGNFDGVHRGHQAILERASAVSKTQGLPVVVITFDPVPKKVLYPETAPPLIQTLDQRLRALEDCKVDHTIVVVFNHEFAHNSPQVFVQRYLVGVLRVRHLVVGKNFSFGHEKQGNVGLLHSMEKEHGFTSEGVQEITLAGKRISSTLIRQLISEGNVEEAEFFLSRPFALIGQVVEGERLGGKLGIPTANLLVENELLPSRGVYISRVTTPAGEFNGVTNVGIRPTVGGKKLTVESHLLNFTGELYGKIVEVHFLKKLRDEMRFASLDALKAQIHADILKAKEYFQEKG